MIVEDGSAPADGVHSLPGLQLLVPVPVGMQGAPWGWEQGEQPHGIQKHHYPALPNLRCVFSQLSNPAQVQTPEKPGGAEPSS